MFIYLFLAIIIIFIVFKVIKNRKDSLKGRIRSTSLAASKNDNSNRTIFDTLVNRIDLNTKRPLVSHDSIRLKCIQAGIRQSRNQKLIILTRYLLIFPVGISSAILAKSISPDNFQLMVIAAIGGMALGFFFPVIRLDSKIKERRKEIDRTFPDFVDLMLICVEAGMTAEQAYERISNDMAAFSLVMSEEIKILSAETTYFLEAKTAYDNFVFRTQSAHVKAYSTIVLQAINYGTPLSQGLRLISNEMRESQVSEVERKAQALPSKLTVPMMLFTLPVLFTVIIYPAAVQVMGA